MLVMNKAEYEYVPESERNDPKPVKFKFRLPTFGDQFNSISLKEGEDGKTTMDLSDFGSKIRHLLCRCLTGWENVVDGNNKPIRFEIARSEKHVDMIPQAMAMELYSHITVEANKGKSEDEQKN